MLTHNLGYPRIGSKRELKKASEEYWSGKTTYKNLLQVAKNIRKENWMLQKNAGIDLIPSNDFSFYDQVLDMSFTVGAIPKRFTKLISEVKNPLDVYFAMARGYQKKGFDVTAMEMTKWFDTNYHYIVPEFYENQEFELSSNKIVDEFYEAKELGIITKPVLIGPISYLLLGKEKETDFNRISLVDNLLPVYEQIIGKLYDLGAKWIQFDEPFLALNLTKEQQQIYKQTYKRLKEKFPEIKIMVTTYFEDVSTNITSIAKDLAIDALHIDLVRSPEQLDTVLDVLPPNIALSLGVVSGRNVWKNDFIKSLKIISKAVEKREDSLIFIAPSCSLLHAPCDLDLEANNEKLTPEIRDWLAFAKQKLREVSLLKELFFGKEQDRVQALLDKNIKSITRRKESKVIHNPEVKDRLIHVTLADERRDKPFGLRKKIQEQELKLPLFPTTTIGSFPQTKEVRKKRFQYKRGEITDVQYEEYLKRETQKAIRWQEQIGLDVLVHGEFERNDMVEYFGEQLEGFVFTTYGWVQSYGSRCVKPPIIYGSVMRTNPMTVNWSTYAQSLTSKLVKGMLTGPLTILQWSFVRDDQPRATTCMEIALAIRDEVIDLEKNGIKVIQIDEPALREGLPLKQEHWKTYLDWAIKAFKISASGVSNNTQIHTHMCYSEFNDIIEYIAAMDADVITIECSRSQMELLDAFATFKYPNDIGPGVYDIHSPRVPDTVEIISLMKKAQEYIPNNQLWVNPDCGLKTRHWEETEKALKAMVAAALYLRASVMEPIA